MRKFYPYILLDTWVLLGFEEFGSLVGSNQSFLQRALIRVHSEWIDHCYDPKLITKPKTSNIQSISSIITEKLIYGLVTWGKIKRAALGLAHRVSGRFARRPHRRESLGSW